MSRHLVAVALGADTVVLIGFLFVVRLASDRLDMWWSQVVPIVAMALALPWLIALVIGYLPVSRLNRAAIVVASAGVFGWVFPTVVRRMTHESGRPVDLGQWRDPYIDGNVSLVTLGACLAIALILAVAAIVMSSKHDVAGSVGDDDAKQLVSAR